VLCRTHALLFYNPGLAFFFFFCVFVPCRRGVYCVFYRDLFHVNFYDAYMFFLSSHPVLSHALFLSTSSVFQTNGLARRGSIRIRLVLPRILSWSSIFLFSPRVFPPPFLSPPSIPVARWNALGLFGYPSGPASTIASQFVVVFSAVPPYRTARTIRPPPCHDFFLFRSLFHLIAGLLWGRCAPPPSFRPVCLVGSALPVDTMAIKFSALAPFSRQAGPVLCVCLDHGPRPKPPVYWPLELLIFGFLFLMHFSLYIGPRRCPGSALPSSFGFCLSFSPPVSFSSSPPSGYRSMCLWGLFPCFIFCFATARFIRT